MSEEELREQIARALYEHDRAALGEEGLPWDHYLLDEQRLALRATYRDAADALLSGPLRGLLANAEAHREALAIRDSFEDVTQIPTEELHRLRTDRAAVQRVQALADAWAAVPPYLASVYDQGRVDQRVMCEMELRRALEGDA